MHHTLFLVYTFLAIMRAAFIGSLPVTSLVSG